jgi:hypothetical protein
LSTIFDVDLERAGAADRFRSARPDRLGFVSNKLGRYLLADLG